MLPAEAPKTPGQSTAEHVTALQYLTDQPTWIKCPYCNQRTKTQVTAEGSSAQWYVFDGPYCPSLAFSLSLST